MPQTLRAAPQAATTWKLCIPWKLFTHIACFISAGCKVSTLTARRAPTVGSYPARGPQEHRASHKLPALPLQEPKNRARWPAVTGQRARVADDEPPERAVRIMIYLCKQQLFYINSSFQRKSIAAFARPGGAPRRADLIGP